MRSLAVAALAILACGPRGDGSASAPVKPTAAPGKLPSGPPLVTPGERMTYRVALQGFELAVFTLTVGNVEELHGRKVIPVEGHAKTVGLASHVAHVDDRFTSWIDLETGLSVKFQADEIMPKTKHVEHSVADLHGRTGNTIPVTYQVDSEPSSVEQQTVSLPEVYDFNSFVVALRAWEGPAGSKATVESFRSRNLWSITTSIGARDKLATELGEFPVLRFEASTVKLGRAGSRAPGNAERHFTIYVSDDGGRVPLLITAKTDYGDVKLTIVDYQPGTGQRIRP